MQRSRALVLLSAFALPLSSSLAQGGPPAAPEKNPRIAAIVKSLGEVKSISAVALSPSGSELAMMAEGALTIGPAANPSGGAAVAICPAAAKGKPDEKAADVSSIAWSPDAHQLAVLATCGSGASAETAVYLVTGGKAHRLTVLHGIAQELAWSPDGTKIGLLYVEGATRPAGALAAMKPPSGVIGVEGLEIQRVASIDAKAGTLTQVTPADLHVYEFDWSPDSAKLAFVAAPAPGENNWWVAKLYTEALGSQPRAILDPGTVSGPLHGLQIAVPRWSPDGSKIAFIGGLMSDQGATGGDLYSISAQGSSPQKLPTGENRTVEWLHWSSDGSLMLTEISNGSEQIVRMNLDPAASQPGATTNPSGFAPLPSATNTTLATLPEAIGDGRLAGSFSLSADGKQAAWIASSFSAAPEVYAGTLADGLKPVTHINTALKPSWGKSESITWTSDNFHVQGWLLYPADYDPAKHYGMIVMVHGGPSSAVVPRWPRAGFGAAPFSAAGYFVLEPNPRGSYGEGEAFTQANVKDFGYGDLRDVLAGVDAVENQIPAIDNNRLGLTGWSYGGFMTMFGVTQTHRFHAAVAGAGISDWLSYYGENSIDQWMTPFFGASVYDDPAVYAKSSAINYIKEVKTPTLIVVGDRDGECPAPQSFEFWHALKAEGVDTRLVVYPDEGHAFRSEDHRIDVLTRAIDWFDTHLTPAESSAAGQ